MWCEPRSPAEGVGSAGGAGPLLPSVKVCTLLDKPSRRRMDVPVDYYGFQVEDRFVVGYGLDYGGKYRNLPYVGVLKPEIYGGG